MKKEFSSMLALAFVWFASALPAAADEPITVAVFDFTDNVGRVLSRDVTALMTANLSTEPRLALVERAKLNKALSEQALGMSGTVNFEAAAKVGQMTGAKVLISGRAIKNKGNLALVANAIGTETGRVVSHMEQGPATNFVVLTSNLAQKIVQTLTVQATNFVVKTDPSRTNRVEAIAQKFRGEHKRTVSVDIKERITGERGVFKTAQNELILILQRAGFTVVDGKAERRPDILIYGASIAASGDKNGNLYSSRATLDIKVQERVSGTILSVDRQQSSALDLSKETARRLALEIAADEIAERLLTALTKNGANTSTTNKNQNL